MVLRAVEEVLLVGRALVGVAGRDRDAVDAELLDVVEERRESSAGSAVEQGAVDVDAEALGLGGLDRRDRLVEDALLADRLVVMLLDRRRDAPRRTDTAMGSNRCSFFSSSSALVQS